MLPNILVLTIVLSRAWLVLSLFIVTLCNVFPLLVIFPYWFESLFNFIETSLSLISNVPPSLTVTSLLLFNNLFPTFSVILPLFSLFLFPITVTLLLKSLLSPVKVTTPPLKFWASTSSSLFPKVAVYVKLPSPENLVLSLVVVYEFNVTFESFLAPTATFFTFILFSLVNSRTPIELSFKLLCNSFPAVAP